MTSDESEANATTIKKAVEEHYAAIAQGKVKSCCNTAEPTPEQLYNIATAVQGYKADDLAAIPEGANLGLGCGDPTAQADLEAGQTVLDLGSGAGIDCFLAARRVGPSGRVIGVDMTDPMLARARENAALGGFLVQSIARCHSESRADRDGLPAGACGVPRTARGPSDALSTDKTCAD